MLHRFPQMVQYMIHSVDDNLSPRHSALHDVCLTGNLEIIDQETANYSSLSSVSLMCHVSSTLQVLQNITLQANMTSFYGTNSMV